MKENLVKLATIISDYEGLPCYVYFNDGGVNFEALCDHIDRWLSQFDDTDRAFVLQHTVNLMSENYYNKSRYIDIISLLTSYPDSQKLFRNGYLLEIQENGGSQKNINSLLNSFLSDKYNIDIPIYKNNLPLNQDSSFFYFDDFSFSGSRLKQDFANFLKDVSIEQIEGKTLYVVLFLSHSYMLYNLEKELKQLMGNTNVNIEIIIADSNKLWGVINNSFMYCTSLSETYFPEENIIEIPERFQCNELYNPRYYRSGNHDNCLLGNNVDRRRIEKIFTEKGFYILSHSNNPSFVIKPLGYSGFNGFGFGGNVFSYRNCPNNTPLVFWWGNYEKNDGTALGCWYPLMARTTY